MLIATRGAEFNFNNQMYKQLDGVAMGSPLGPTLAKIFLGFHDCRRFDNTVKPGVYARFVDNTLAIFGSELGCDHFQEKLNLLHPALKFTVEKEQNNSLNFIFGRERGHWISSQYLQETNFYWTIHPLEFL